MTTQFQKDRQAAEDASQRERTLEAFRQWLRTHPEVPACMAVERLFEEYMDFADPQMDADFEFALGNLRSRITLQRVPTDAEAKESLVNEIIELLRTGGVSHTVHTLASERTRLSYFTVEQLQERRNAIVRAQAAAAKPLPQLKAEVAEARRDTRKYPGYPDLPLEIVPQGRVRAVRVDAKYLKTLDPVTLRKMVQRFSVQQINDAIRERITE